MTMSEPTTGEIVRALRFCYESEEIECYECPCRVIGGTYLCHMDKLADRLESQEREIERLKEELEQMEEAATVLHAANETHWTYIKELTARAEQAEAREKAVIRCSECAHLNVINSDIVYAQCKKYGFAFFPFEADTRETGCTHGERGLPQE